MSKRALILLTAILAASLACTVTLPFPSSFEGITGSGEVVTVTPDLADFDQIEASYAFDVEVVEGRTFSVTIRIDDNLTEYLDARVDGSTLILGLDPSIGFNFGATTLEAEVTMPALRGVEASGASKVRLTGFESSDDLRLTASGASTILGEISAGDFDMDLSGASSVTLAGSGDTLSLLVSGASSADLGDLEVNDVRAELSGASHATVSPSGTLDAEASGASVLTYRGTPTLGTIDVSGASRVESE